MRWVRVAQDYPLTILLSTAEIDRDFRLPSALLARNSGIPVRADKTQVYGFAFDRRDQPLQEQPHATFRGRSRIQETKSEQREHLTVDVSE